jgi:hypothetical protein
MKRCGVGAHPVADLALRCLRSHAAARRAGRIVREQLVAAEAFPTRWRHGKETAARAAPHAVSTSSAPPCAPVIVKASEKPDQQEHDDDYADDSSGKHSFLLCRRASITVAADIPVRGHCAGCTGGGAGNRRLLLPKKVSRRRRLR